MAGMATMAVEAGGEAEAKERCAKSCLTFVVSCEIITLCEQRVTRPRPVLAIGKKSLLPLLFLLAEPQRTAKRRHWSRLWALRNTSVASPYAQTNSHPTHIPRKASVASYSTLLIRASGHVVEQTFIRRRKRAF